MLSNSTGFLVLRYPMERYSKKVTDGWISLVNNHNDYHNTWTGILSSKIYVKLSRLSKKQWIFRVFLLFFVDHLGHRDLFRQSWFMVHALCLPLLLSHLQRFPEQYQEVLCQRLPYLPIKIVTVVTLNGHAASVKGRTF